MKHIISAVILIFFTIYSYCQPFGNVISLNGTDDYFTVPDNSSLNQTSTISVEAWINLCDTVGINSIISKHWCGGEQNAYSFRVRSGKLEWASDNNGCSDFANTYRSNDAVIEPYTWNHVAVVHTPTNISLYLNGNLINGTLVTGNHGNIQVSDQPLRVGAYRNSAGEIVLFFDGMIDEIRVWDYDLDAAEILSRFDIELLGDESGLVCYYDMNNDTGVGSGVDIANKSTITGSILNGTTVGTATSPSFIPFDNQCQGAPTGVNEFYTNFYLYPNPTTGNISIDLGEVITNLEVELINILGQVILVKEFPSTDFINLNIDATRGVYFLRLKNNHGNRRTFKILKE